MRLNLVTSPTAEPLLLQDAIEHLNLDLSTPDTRKVETLIKVARHNIERVTGRALITQTWELWLDGFPCDRIVLPKPPVQSVTSITYLDAQGQTQTWDSGDYRVSLPAGPQAGPARIEPAYGTVYPTTRCVIDAVKVRYVAGYGDEPTDVPEDLRHALRVLIGTWYDVVVSGVNVGNITSELPQGVRYLLGPYVVKVPFAVRETV